MPLLLGALFFWLRPKEKEEVATGRDPAHRQAVPDQDPRDFAMQFLASTHPDARLGYVRNAGLAKAHFARYPKQALREKAQIVAGMPIIHRGDLSYYRFVAQFEDGSRRLLSIVNTPDGLKVDWDCFARYTSAPWEDLSAAKVPQAEIRVFAKKTSNDLDYGEHVKWTRYALSSPDTTDIFYTYLKNGSEQDLKVRSILESTDRNQKSSRLTLLVSTDAQNPGRRILKTEKILALGWVTPDHAALSAAK